MEIAFKTSQKHQSTSDTRAILLVGPSVSHLLKLSGPQVAIHILILAYPLKVTSTITEDPFKLTA